MVVNFKHQRKFPVGQYPVSSVIGDFNADGKQDLATGNHSGHVSILISNGDGTFQPARNFGTGNSVYALDAVDMNADGALDLAVVNTGSGNVTLLLNSCTSGGLCNGNELFCDDFQDGIFDSNKWSVIAPSFFETGGNMAAQPDLKEALVEASGFGGCIDCSIEAGVQIESGVSGKVSIYGWFIDKKNAIVVIMKSGSKKFVIKQIVNGELLAKTKVIVPGGILSGHFYNIKFGYDSVSNNFSLIINGNLLQTMPAAVPPNGRAIALAARKAARFSYITVQ